MAKSDSIESFFSNLTEQKWFIQPFSFPCFLLYSFFEHQPQAFSYVLFFDLDFDFESFHRELMVFTNFLENEESIFVLKKLKKQDSISHLNKEKFYLILCPYHNKIYIKNFVNQNNLIFNILCEKLNNMNWIFSHKTFFRNVCEELKPIEKVFHKNYAKMQSFYEEILGEKYQTSSTNQLLLLCLYISFAWRREASQDDIINFPHFLPKF